VSCMIIQIKNKLHDSMKESIGIRLTNQEMAKIVHHYLYTNPSETVFLLNGNRNDNDPEDALLTGAEAKQFIGRLEKYLEKEYPNTHKKISSIEVA